MNDNANNGATTMNENTDNGATTMKALRNSAKSRTSAFTPKDNEEMWSPMVDRKMKSATPPMSAEEEREAFREMIAAAVRGDDVRRNKLRNRIFTSMIRLVFKITTKTVEWHREQYKTSSISFLDYLHGGYSALCDAIDKFNPDKGTRLSTYAVTAIINKQNDMAFIRQYNKGKIPAMKSLEETYGCDWERSLSDSIADNSEPIDSQVSSNETRLTLWAGIGQLSQRERDCICAKYELVDGCTKLADVADKYGITAARASQITKEAVKKLRAQFAA